MIFFLILGAILGGVSVVFILQNTTLVTITFLTWQFEGSLAPVLFLTLMGGALITSLLLLPSLIKDTYYFSRMKKQKNLLEDELVATKQLLADAAVRPLTRAGATDTTPA